MKTIMEFDLPDDEDEFFLASNGWRYRHALYDFEGYLRQLYNGKIELKSDDYIDEIYDELKSIIQSWGVDLSNDVS